MSEHKETPDHVVEAYARVTIMVMEDMTPEQRTMLLSLVLDHHCQHCGRNTADGRRCQCRNDD